MAASLETSIPEDYSVGPKQKLNSLPRITRIYTDENEKILQGKALPSRRELTDRLKDFSKSLSYSSEFV
jgi:hypothetical protein